MGSTRRDRLNRNQAQRGNRYIAPGPGPAALPEPVAAPTPDRPVGGQRHGVRRTRRKPVPAPRHQSRNGTCRHRHHGAVTEFPVPVVAPRDERSVGPQRQAVVAAPGDGDRVVEAQGGHRVIRRDRGTVAELPAYVRAPSPHGARLGGKVRRAYDQAGKSHETHCGPQPTARWGAGPTGNISGDRPNRRKRGTHARLLVPASLSAYLASARDQRPLAPGWLVGASIV